MLMMRKGRIFLVLGVIAGFVAVWYGATHGWIPGRQFLQSIVPKEANLPQAQAPVAKTSAPEMPLPTNAPANKGSRFDIRIMAWNTQLGMILANGGATTKTGSLNEKYGINMSITRTDDTSVQRSELIKFAQAYKNGQDFPTDGSAFVCMMGDGTPAWITETNAVLKKLGPEYQAEIIGSTGLSLGEDKLLGPEAWLSNPQLARGSVIVVVILDGDWNIIMKWAGDNKIPVNPDTTTYDPSAINIWAVDDFVKAGEVYITGQKEERPVVKNGKKTGDKKTVQGDAVSSWTPVDVNVAKKRGGLVKIVSTKEYRWQMPQAIIGVRKWNRDHADLLTNMLAAIYEAGDQIKSYPRTLTKAAELSAKVYGEQDGAYWEKYFKGVTEMDATGKMVELGGSSVFNLADAMFLFGLFPGSQNLFANTYTVFGDIAVQQYPKRVPNYQPAAEVINASYVEAVAKRSAKQVTLAEAEVPAYSSTPIKQTVSKADWTINFKSGSADFTPATERVMQELLRQINVTSLKVEIHGHTDSIGGREFNQGLSEKRAFAVKHYLEAKAPANFPPERTKIAAHGMEQPIAPNSTEAGRAKNRRVEIVLGQ